ncbi:hypothetical protein KHA94_17380 [Bacillus sp. FJAT-49705]|uniref:Uncharacterized protein n=1 Tax=Cytobacillus citreus TaxID=2833586 RepID=A0ABS5NVS3_9BACI|nr:hypothetical protein [Cytobacillus citreus]MBS4191942.1 hypothetical protein [Cytobacillus citreus]
MEIAKRIYRVRKIDFHLYLLNFETNKEFGYNIIWEKNIVSNIIWLEELNLLLKLFLKSIEQELI